MMKGAKGITLIALVITIIVMLILAGVTINIVVNGGLFKQAQNAVSATDISQTKEQIQTDLIAAIMEKGDNVTADDINSILANYTSAGTAAIDENGQITFSGLVTKNGNAFTLDSMSTFGTGSTNNPSGNGGNQSGLGSTDGSFNGTVNTPKLGTGMTEVAWNSSGDEITPTTQSDWYDYTAQAGLTTLVW
jgi:hypothetical protein